MEYYGRTLEEAVHNAVNRKQYNSHKYNGLQLQKKQRFDVPAPAKSWGVWVELWSQFGVTGPNRDNYQSIIGISYETISRGPSTFDVEIMGGDDFIRTVGGGSSTVTVTGNVATSIFIRCRSHLLLQHVVVTLKLF